MSAITLRLGRRSDSAELRLRLPAPPDEIRQKLVWLDNCAEDRGKPLELRGVSCEIAGINQDLRQADLSREGELDRLNALAEKIENMDWMQRDVFCGALDCESINSLDDVFRVADSLDQYEFLEGVCNNRDLGVHLVETGWKEFPNDVLPYLDYAAIGIEYHAEHTGAFTGSGYVRKKGVDRQMEAGESKVPVLTVRLYAPGTNTPCSLDLPASDGLLEQTLRTLGISEFAEADIHGIEDHSGCMGGCADLDCPSVETLNELARFVSNHFTTDQDWVKFEAVCEAAQVGTWQEMLDVAGDLDNYRLYDTCDPEEFGGLRAEELIERGADITVEMEDFITYDYRGFGLREIQDHGVRESAYGYVRRLSEPFPSLDFEQTMGQL